MNLLRRVLEMLGLGTESKSSKKVSRSLRQKAYRQAQARKLFFEQNEERVVMASVSAAAMVGTVNEGAAAVVYFNLSQTVMSPVTVNYHTVAGTASENSDYQGVTGTATIGPGQNFATVSVNTSTDAETEPAETFSVTITSVSGATLGTASAPITINNVAGNGAGVVSVAAGSSHVSEGTYGTVDIPSHIFASIPSGQGKRILNRGF